MGASASRHILFQLPANLEKEYQALTGLVPEFPTIPKTDYTKLSDCLGRISYSSNRLLEYLQRGPFFLDPEVFTAALKKHEIDLGPDFDWDNVVIAGGFLPLAYEVIQPSNDTSMTSDLDFFILNGDRKAFERTIRYFRDRIVRAHPQKVKVRSTLNTVTFEPSTSTTYSSCPIQVILTDMPSPNTLIANFDLDHVRAYYTGKEVIIAKATLEAWNTKQLHDTGLKRRQSRILKALRKGFMFEPLPDLFDPDFQAKSNLELRKYLEENVFATKYLDQPAVGDWVDITRDDDLEDLCKSKRSSKVGYYLLGKVESSRPLSELSRHHVPGICKRLNDGKWTYVTEFVVETTGTVVGHKLGFDLGARHEKVPSSYTLDLNNCPENFQTLIKHVDKIFNESSKTFAMIGPHNTIRLDVPDGDLWTVEEPTQREERKFHLLLRLHVKNGQIEFQVIDQHPVA